MCAGGDPVLSVEDARDGSWLRWLEVVRQCTGEDGGVKRELWGIVRRVHLSLWQSADLYMYEKKSGVGKDPTESSRTIIPSA